MWFKRLLLSSIFGVSLLAIAPGAFAVGECGLACCIGGTSSSGIMLADNFGVSVQYESMDMGTIRHGTDEISPNAVIDKFWTMGSSYAVPTSMKMEKVTFVAAKPINERWQVMGIVPYVRNNMDMRRKSAMGMVMNMKMAEVSGLGDVSIMGVYTAYTDAPIRATKRLTLGFGIKTPTGENDVRTSSGSMVHAMMQPGSGSWDGLFTLNYMRAWYPVIAQVNMFYHLTTEGDTGYEFGDQLGVAANVRYQASNYTNLGLELSLIHASSDKDYDGNYSKIATSMLDNPANTGLTSIFIAPNVQFKIPNTGGNVQLKYQIPLRQDVNGYQQVVDSRWLLAGSWVW